MPRQSQREGAGPVPLVRPTSGKRILGQGHQRVGVARQRPRIAAATVDVTALVVTFALPPVANVSWPSSCIEQRQRLRHPTFAQNHGAAPGEVRRTDLVQAAALGEEDVMIRAASVDPPGGARYRSRSELLGIATVSFEVSTTAGSALRSSANTSERATRSSSTSPAPERLRLARYPRWTGTWRSPAGDHNAQSSYGAAAGTQSTPISLIARGAAHYHDVAHGEATGPRVSSPRDGEPTAYSARVSSAVATSGNPRSKHHGASCSGLGLRAKSSNAAC